MAGTPRSLPILSKAIPRTTRTMRKESFIRFLFACLIRLEGEEDPLIMYQWVQLQKTQTSKVPSEKSKQRESRQIVPPPFNRPFSAGL